MSRRSRVTQRASVPVLALLLVLPAAAQPAVTSAGQRRGLDVRLHLSSSRDASGVLLRATIRSSGAATCSLRVRPPRHIAGLPARFEASGLRTDKRGRATTTQLFSPAAPAGRWTASARCALKARRGSATARIRLGKGRGRLGGSRSGPVCDVHAPEPGCVSLAPVAQSSLPEGGLGAAGGCRPFGTVLVPASAWLGGHGVDVISNGCTYESYIYGPYGWEWQCVELFERLINQAGWFHGGVSTSPSGGAKDLYPNAPAAAFDKHGNGSGYRPVPGDAIVFYGTKADPSGHVAIVRSVESRSIDVVEQNDEGSGTATLSFSGTTIGNEGGLVVEGVLHAKANTLSGNAYKVTGPAGGLDTHSAPQATAPVVGHLAVGTVVTIICQTTGSPVGGSSIWDEIAGRAYLPDYYLSTPSFNAFSPGLPQCVPQSGSTFVMTSGGSRFSPSQPWSGTPFVGSRATLSCDATGDGKADLIAVDDNATFVMPSTGTAFGAVQGWSGTPFYGTKATLAADATGDGRADLIAVDDNATFVVPSTGTAFGAVQGWSGTPFYGTKATLAADATGDGRADLIAVDDNATFVMPSSGTAFGAVQGWSGTPFYGTKATLAADATGDGRADLIAVDDNATFVMPSSGTAFGAVQGWSSTPFYGTKATLAADATGDGRADLIAVDDNATFVMPSSGTAFGAVQGWSGTPFYGTKATLAADATGDGRADLIAVNYDAGIG